jgi:hypothetical protein
MRYSEEADLQMLFENIRAETARHDPRRIGPGILSSEVRDKGSPGRHPAIKEIDLAMVFCSLSTGREEILNVLRQKLCSARQIARGQPARFNAMLNRAKGNPENESKVTS